MADHIIHTARGDLLSAFLKPRLGSAFVDVRDSLAVHKTRRFGNMDSRGCAFVALHHSASRPDTTVDAVARYHVGTNGWAGIGYHFVVRNATVYYVGDVDTERAHVAGRNNEALGICVMGDFTKTAPAKESMDAVRLLVKALDEYYGRKKELVVHRDMLPAGHTTCPGDYMAPLVHKLRDDVGFNQEDLSAATWYVEQLANARAGRPGAIDVLVNALRWEPASQSQHDVILKAALPPLYKLRDKK